ncbi:MAG: AtpZ/AtpI family protein [Acidimicrobiia bacterium]
MRSRANRTEESVSTRPVGSGDGFSQALGLVLGPVALALVGRGIDVVFGIAPLLTILFAVLGVIGAFATAYYRYIADMDRLDAGQPWTSKTESVA